MGRNPLCVQLDMENENFFTFFNFVTSQSAMRAIRYGVVLRWRRSLRAKSQSAMRAIRYGAELKTIIEENNVSQSAMRAIRYGELKD